MPSPLAKYALQLNQQVNDYFCSYFVSWDDAAEEMKMEKNRRKLRAYTCFLYWVSFCVLPACVFLLIINIHYPEMLNLRQTMVVSVNLMGGLMGLFVNSVYILNGNELVKVLNYTIRSEHKFGIVYKNRKAGLRQFLNEYQRFAKGQSEDLMGFLMTYVVIFHIIVMAVAPVFFLVRNIDPSYCLVVVFESKEIFGTLACTNLSSNIFVLVVRYVIIIISWQLFQISLRTIPTILIFTGMTFLMLLQNLKSVSDWRYGIQLYRELLIIINYYNACLKHSSSTYLGIGGAMTAFCVSFAIVCIKFFGHIQTGMFFVFVGASCLSLVSLFLHCGDLFYEISKSIVHKWKKSCALSSYHKRIIQSFNAIKFKIGDVGIIDRDIKMNYCDNILNNIVTILVAVNDFYL